MTAIRLGAPLLVPSSGVLKTPCGRRVDRSRHGSFNLAPGGVYLARDVSASAVCFYHTGSTVPSAVPRPEGMWRSEGGLVSVALSFESLRPAVNRHPCPLEPGLSSRSELPATVLMPSAFLSLSNSIRIWEAFRFFSFRLFVISHCEQRSMSFLRV